jgi:hypothetical protein
MYKSEYDSFISSPIWHEIVETLKEVKAGLLEDLQSLDPFAQTTELARQQGRLKMLEFMLLMPEDILREINSKLEEKTEDNNE